jgi:ABC-2 type transport system permease protein
MYYLWKTVFANTGGTLLDLHFPIWSFSYFLSNATRFLIHSEATYTVAEEIVEGSISMRLIKPVRLDLSLMFTDLGGTILTFLLIFIPMLIGIEIYRFVEFGVWMISPVRILLFLFSASLSFLVNFYFDLCFGFMAFFLKNLWDLAFSSNPW